MHTMDAPQTPGHSQQQLDSILDEVRASDGHGIVAPLPGMLLDLDVICAAYHDLDDGPERLTSVELVERAGITYRQLDYATRTGRLRALATDRSGSGYRRTYPPEELAVAIVLRVLGLLRH